MYILYIQVPLILGHGMTNTIRRKRNSPETVRDGTQTHASKSCDNHGGCPFCEGNRLKQSRVTDQESLDKISNWEDEIIYDEDLEWGHEEPEDEDFDSNSWKEEKDFK